MYKIIKMVIDKKDYELGDMLGKIAEKRIQNKITDEEEKELYELARANAIPENSYASVEKRFESVYEELSKIKARLSAIENKDISGTIPIEPVEEYPEYIQPTGAHDSYKTGDKITYNGKKYVCKMDNCVWSPETYPVGWEEVTEV